MREALKVWVRNERQIEEAIINGEEVEVVESDFGANEFLLDFLKESGLWDIITQMVPVVKKDNGYPSKIILGTLVMKELLSIGKLSGMGKITRDGKLMADIGFNIERITQAKKKDQGVIDLGTVRNHLKRIPREESEKALYHHLRLLRKKRWIRGQEYVADAVKLEVPYGETFEGRERVWDKKEKRYIYGYKLELLMNVTSTGRLRFIGAALAPINADERVLLIKIFQRIERYLGKGKVREIIETLTLDRGYWGAHFLWKLKNIWGVDFIILIRDDDLHLAQATELYLEGINPSFEDKWITVKKEGKEERKKMRVAGINGLALRRYSRPGKYQDWGEVNVVVVLDEDKEGKIRRKIYVTSLKAEEHPFKIYQLYKDRWVIENQGIRYLSQRWNLRDLAGRTLNSIQARIFSVLMLYNAVKILEMKYEGKMEKLEKKMRERGELSYLSGARLIVYGRERYYGVFSGVEYAHLVAQYTAKTVAQATAKRKSQEIAKELEKILLQKESKKKIAQFIRRLREE